MDFVPYKPIYEVVESETFTSQLPLFLNSIHHWDSIKESIECDLARNPKLAYKIPETEVYVLPLSTVPPLTIYYFVDEAKEQIILLEIHKI